MDPEHDAWIGAGWLPRMPASLEELDVLLLTVAKPRIVHRDGIHLFGQRYIAPTLAPYLDFRRCWAHVSGKSALDLR